MPSEKKDLKINFCVLQHWLSLGCFFKAQVVLCVLKRVWCICFTTARAWLSVQLMKNNSTNNFTIRQCSHCLFLMSSGRVKPSPLQKVHSCSSGSLDGALGFQFPSLHRGQFYPHLNFEKVHLTDFFFTLLLLQAYSEAPCCVVYRTSISKGREL